MDPNQSGSPWTSLCISLLTRTRELARAQPKFFVTWAAIVYVPLIIFDIISPWSDALFTTATVAALYAGALVVNGAVAWYAVAAIRAGDTPTMEGVKEALKPFRSALILTTLVAVVVEFAGAIIILPGALMLFWIFFAGPIVCEEGLKGWPVIDRGRRYVSDYRWSQVAGALFLAWSARRILEILPRFINKLQGLAFSETPAVVEWLLKAIGWGLDIVTLSVISVWAVIAYFDIRELLLEQAKLPSMTPEDGEAPSILKDGVKIALPTISIPSGFSPSVSAKRIVQRLIEFVMLGAIGACSWWAISPHPVFDQPPSSMVISNVKLAKAPPRLEGHIVNESGHDATKATWVVSLPAGYKGAPSAIVVVNFKNGDARDFSVPVPNELNDVPDIKPFRVEWAK